MNERFTPPDKTLKRISGLLVVDSGISQNSNGTRRTWYDLQCKCGTVFRTTQNWITFAKRGEIALRCDSCKTKAYQQKQKAHYRKVKKQKSATWSASAQATSQKAIYASRVVENSRPPITAGAVKTLSGHADKPYYRRVLQILAAYVDACVNAGSELHWNRGAVEAIERAQQEERAGTLADADCWTPDTITQGLCRVSFPQYQTPYDANARYS